MSTRPSRVTVIIVNYNTPHLTRELIESVAAASSETDYNIVVVDNSSTPDGRYYPGEGGNERVLHLNRNIGFGRAVNLAARMSQVPYLLLANSDCRVTRNVIGSMIDFLDDNSTCAACSPKVISPRGQVHSTIRRMPNHANIISSRGSLWPFSHGGYTVVADDSRKKVEAMSATFMMVRRELFEQVGGFDESYFMYVEDTDLCRRFSALGKDLIYLGDLQVLHRWGSSTRQRPLRMKFEHHRSIRRYFLLHFPRRRLANTLLSIALGVNLTAIALMTAVCRRRPSR
jgi:N-acetylglucosaminyl-diphospho-decaprenol L-rhamnosyltransferase